MEKINASYNYFYGDKDNPNTIAKFDFQDETEIIPINEINTVYKLERSNDD